MRQGENFSHKAPPAGTHQETAGHMPAWGQQAFLLNLPHPLHKPEMRQPLRAVMRYAGPRTLLRHMAETLRRKRRSSHAGSTAFVPVERG